MNNEMDACPDCGAINHGNISCVTCLEKTQEDYPDSTLIKKLLRTQKKKNNLAVDKMLGETDESA